MTLHFMTADLFIAFIYGLPWNTNIDKNFQPAFHCEVATIYSANKGKASPFLIFPLRTWGMLMHKKLRLIALIQFIEIMENFS